MHISSIILYLHFRFDGLYRYDATTKKENDNNCNN